MSLYNIITDIVKSIQTETYNPKLSIVVLNFDDAVIVNVRYDGALSLLSCHFDRGATYTSIRIKDDIQNAVNRSLKINQ